MKGNIAICHSSVQEPEELTIMVKCDYCPYCGRKAAYGHESELHIFGDQTSVVFHSPIVAPNEICEIPDSWEEGR